MSAPIRVLGSGLVGQWAARGVRELAPQQPLWVAFGRRPESTTTSPCRSRPAAAWARRPGPPVPRG